MTWCQTLGEDMYSVLNDSHGTVVRNEDGSYGNITGIETVQGSKVKVQSGESIYDLTGRRVEKMQKGTYFVNGKKTLVK